MSKDPQINPLTRLLEAQGFVVLDGGLATSLEFAGHELDDELWSASVLLEEPEAIRRVHSEFLCAGADCIATSSYQASFAGFRRRGLSDGEGERLLRLSVELAIEAREEFWADPVNRQGRVRPLVAASVGPYGAFLADGSEYRGRYGITDDELRTFHQRRWQVLAGSGAELLACETIPSRREADVLRTLLRETAGRWAWISFSCRDGEHLSDGNRLLDAARDCDREARVAGVGINCTSPAFIPSLITEARKGTGKPIIVYPNSGEAWDAETKSWRGRGSTLDWQAAAIEWRRLGAAAVGGCCRVGPQEITMVRRGLVRGSTTREAK